MWSRIKWNVAAQSALQGGRVAREPPDKPSSPIATWSAHALFAALATIEVVRTLRHAMWRDEMEAYIVAVRSATPWELLHNIRYEEHPALWYALIWLVTRVGSDPMRMQLLHIVMALGVWCLVYFRSPFGALEKIFLLLSYFLFWEYFVVSRDYALIALLGFSFIALREQKPRPELALWLLLGLLANTHLYGAIWSMVLAATLLVDNARCRSANLLGAGLYLCLLAFAVYTLMPQPDVVFSRPPPPAPDLVLWGYPLANVSHVDEYLTTPYGALAPFSVASLRGAMAFVLHPSAAAIPDFWNVDATNDLRGLTHPDAAHSLRVALAFAAPVALCWFVVRNWLLVLEFALVYAGIVAFNDLWGFSGVARHHGLVFLALVAAVWSARARCPSSFLSRWLFAAVLMINACGGVLSLASELRPFSEGRDTAAWLRANHLDDAFLVGSRDARVQTVAGYLGRTIYYLECKCTYAATIEGRIRVLSPQQFGERLIEAVGLANGQDAILIRDQPVDAGELASTAPTLSTTFLASFTNAATDEKFWVYRVAARSSP